MSLVLPNELEVHRQRISKVARDEGISIKGQLHRRRTARRAPRHWMIDSLSYYVRSLTGIVFASLRVQLAMLPYTAFARDKFSSSLGVTTCTSKEAPDARCVCKYAGYTT